MATIRVIKNNKQREKTAGQKANEAIELDKQYRKAGKENLGHGKTAPGKNASVKIDEGVDTRKQIADDVGVGEGTIQKGMDVKRMAYPEEYVHDDLRNPEKYDVSEEVREKAREQVEENSGVLDDEKSLSINKAMKISTE